MGINNEQEECRALHFSIIECVGEAYKTIPPALLPLQEGIYRCRENDGPSDSVRSVEGMVVETKTKLHVNESECHVL